MPEKPHNFWQELKRRKVIRVIIGYAAASYVILELISIIAEPFGLPDWTLRLVFILLCIGFIIAVVLSWIYDFTASGIERTEPVKLKEENEKITKPSAKKIKVSDIVIAVLIVAVVVLAYPRIFKKDKFSDIRDEEGKISVVVMPFQNLSGDSLFDPSESFLQDLIITELSNSDELSVRHTQAKYDQMWTADHMNYASITPSIASDFAKKLNANTVIFGSLNTSGNTLIILAKLMNSNTQEIYKSYRIDGDYHDNISSLADSLSLLIKNFLEIKVLEKDLDSDVRLFSNTESAEAYRYFSKGLDKFFTHDMESASELFISALKLDPDFLWAKLFLLTSYSNMDRYVQARQIIDNLYQEIDDYGYLDQLYINYMKCLYDKNGSAGSEYLRKINAEIPYSRGWWYEAGRYYTEQMNQYQLAVEALEKSLEIDQKWGGNWKWVHLYSLLGRAYHETGQRKKEQEIYELGLSINHDYDSLIYRQAVCAFSMRDTINGIRYLDKYKQMLEVRNLEEHWINYNIGSIYNEAEQYSDAIHIYRNLIEEYPDDPWSKAALASVLINNDLNINEGMTLIDLALEHRPENHNFIITKAWGLYKQGEFRESLELLKKAWDLRPYYSHEHYLKIQEVEQALANQKSEQ